ncbi:tRNA lysidine(34) synthetase TilS [Ruminococcaceae bacterium OttesenSCG-928-I18]|nr:tRNA lysidine(34) synthetase TilS [Ruminococcaceae bacterium OttesenSCG-928-I18]
MKNKTDPQAAVLDYIHRESLLSPGDRVIVALSGGADSVALFYLLLENREHLEIELEAAHFNHGLRGPAADEDEAFVRRLCEKEGVPLSVEQGHMSRLPRPKGEGTEAWAHRLRYAFFERLAKSHDAKIATGHTLSDNAETVLFHAIRGAGTRGLSGIAASCGPFVRPLLVLSRAEVRQFCAQRGHEFVLDATNEDTVYTRNLLRLEALPVLERAHPGAERSLHRLALNMGELDGWLTELATSLLSEANVEDAAIPPGWRLPSYDVQTLLSAPAPVRKKALSLLLGRGAEAYTLSALEGLLGGETSCLNLPGGCRAHLRAGRLLFAREAPPSFPSRRCNLHGQVFVLPAGYRIEMGVEEMPQAGGQFFEKQKKDYTFRADYDKINQYGILRTRREGDSFHEAGRRHRKSLKKWMIEKGIDRELRAALPLIASVAQEEVLWVWGAGFAHRLQPDAGTKKICWIKTAYRPPDNKEGHEHERPHA